MVLLTEGFSKYCSKLENQHHHDEPEVLSASLHLFQSDVSNYLSQFLLNSKPTSQIPSFPWMHQCFEVLSITHKAFAKLVVNIDYPISKWESASVDEFLKYTLKLLELFNSISSSLSHLGQSRLELSHALALVQTSSSSSSATTERLKPIKPTNHSKNLEESNEDGKDRKISGKESVIHQALVIMREIGLWVCGIGLSFLCGDDKIYMEMRKSVISLLSKLDSVVLEVLSEKGAVLSEIEEVNDAVGCLVAAMATEEGSEAEEAEKVERKMGEFEKNLDGFGKLVDRVFSEVLEERNKVIDSLRVNLRKE